MKKKNLLLITIVILLFFTSGCDLFQKNKEHLLIPDFKIKEDGNRAKNIIRDSTKIIEKKSDNISTVAVEIQSKISEKNNIEFYLDDIKKDIKIIINDVKIINEENIKIKTTIPLLNNIIEKTETIEKLSKEIEIEKNKLEERLKLAEESAKAETRKLLQRIIFISILGFGGSVALMLLGNAKLGIVGIGGSLSTLILSIVINQHIVLISWVGMGIIVILLLYLIYESFIQGKIKRELIETTELVKENLLDEKREELFGKKSDVKRIQSLETENEVRRIKNKIKKGVSKNT